MTHLVEHAHGWSDFALAASILVLLWWLYSGWLCSSARLVSDCNCASC
ncbi:MAG: hypothetical protein IPG42_15610 [Betaproteobacteria bacterium]|nr:hypothetical protein [Betaproteobacteria bacterium]